MHKRRPQGVQLVRQRNTWDLEYVTTGYLPHTPVQCHNILHEGSPVRQGRKHVICSDIMYSWKTGYLFLAYKQYSWNAS